MEKYIIIALIIIFGVVSYFDKQPDKAVVALEQSSTLELDKNKPKGKSFWKIITDHNKRKNYYKDRGITVKSSNKPDSDTSACVGVTKSDKDMIITQFVGYVLQYPCTIKHEGEYHIEYNPDGIILSQRYRLNITVVLGQENGSIWWTGNYDDLMDALALRIQLFSNGKKRSNKPIEDWIKNAKKIKVIDSANLVIFRKGNYVRAFIKDLFKSKVYVSIKCNLAKDTNIHKLFSPFNDEGINLSCSASWKLTEDIAIRVLNIQPKYAYQFYKIYQEINNKIYSIFIQYPTKKQE